MLQLSKETPLIWGILKLFQKLGIDGAVFYTSIARIVQAFGGILIIYLIAISLTGEEQGYYYTFRSILAIQLFFELGLNGIIVQFVAHEKANLTFKEDGTLTGAKYSESRIASLFSLILKWYSVLSVLFIIALLVVGFVYFSTFSKNDLVDWKSPWIILSFFTGVNLFLSPIIAFIEGVGKVKDIAKMRIIQQSFSLLMVATILLLGGKLYASAIAAISLSITTIAFIASGRSYRVMLINLYRYNVTDSISYRHEIFPYQWRIALSAISGYFIFYFFNPILFIYQSPIIAGKMGMTLAGFTGIFAISQSWTTTKVPKWSGFIAQKKYAELDKSSNLVFLQSSLICFVGCGIYIAAIYLLRSFNVDVADRFLDTKLIAILSIVFLINNIVFSMATYLRCHKKEPFLYNSITKGILCFITTYLTARYLDISGVVICYTLLSMVISLWGVKIFLTKKKEWHK